MLKSIFRDSGPFSQLVLSLAFTVAIFISILIASMLFAMPLFSLSFNELLACLSNVNAENIHILKYFQLVQGIGLFMIPPVLLAFLYSPEPQKWLPVNRLFSIEAFFLVSITMVFLLPVINLLAQWNANMHLPDSLKAMELYMKTAEEKAAVLTELFLKMDNLGSLFFNIILIALIPAIGEEFFFRGLIQKHITGIARNVHWGIIITAFLFSAFHMQFYGFVPRFLLGVLFGYLLLWSGSIWLPILAHFVNNAFAVVSYYVVSGSGKTEKLQEIGTDADSWFLSVVSAIIVTYLLFLVYKNLKVVRT